MHLVGDGPTGVLVLAGSSGRVEEERCRVLAAAGATAASYRWFGETVDLVPLESFDEPLALLHERCERLVVLGTSRGAEAALLLGAAASRDRRGRRDLTQRRRLGLALLRSPPALVVDARGEPLPFVPYDDSWETDTDPPEFVGHYEQALELYADRVPAARIPVERIAGEVVLVAGGDDRVWPALDFSDEIVARRDAVGRATTLVTHPPGRPPGGAARREPCAAAALRPRRVRRGRLRVGSAGLAAPAAPPRRLSDRRRFESSARSR